MWNNLNNDIVSPMGDSSIKIKFPCPNCSAIITTDCFKVYAPHNAEKNADSSNEFEHEVICSNIDCEEEHILNCQNSNGGFHVDIDEVDASDIFYETC